MGLLTSRACSEIDADARLGVRSLNLNELRPGSHAMNALLRMVRASRNQTLRNATLLTERSPNHDNEANT